MPSSPRKPPASQPVTAAVQVDNNLALAVKRQKSSREESTASALDSLAAIAEQVWLTAGADGAAIALEKNGSVTCRASAGDCAPSIGAVLDRGSGLSGVCLRSGELVRCDDVHSDERVDAAVARVLEIRSILAVPVRRDEQTIGLVEVLSRRPRAFAGKEEETLRAAAAQILRTVKAEEAGHDLRRTTHGAWERTAVTPMVAAEENARTAAFLDILDMRPVGADESTPADASPDKLRALFAFVASSAPTLKAQAGGPEKLSVKSGSVVPFPVRAEAQHGLNPEARPEATAPDISQGTARFEPAHGQSAASAGIRGAILGAVTLVILGGIGLGIGRFISAPAPHSAKAAVQAAVTEVEQLQRSAGQGDAAAQYQLAVRHLSGDDVTRSEADAISLFLKSAHSGNSGAQYQLGRAYEQGSGVPRELVKAYAFYVMAGANGNPDADAAQNALTHRLTLRQIGDVRMLLGQMYEQGVGTPADKEQAYVWFSLAEAAGTRKGQREKALLASKMSKAQVATATRRASDWLKRHKQAPR